MQCTRRRAVQGAASRPVKPRDAAHIPPGRGSQDPGTEHCRALWGHTASIFYTQTYIAIQTHQEKTVYLFQYNCGRVYVVFVYKCYKICYLIVKSRKVSGFFQTAWSSLVNVLRPHTLVMQFAATWKTHACGLSFLIRHVDSD